MRQLRVSGYRCVSLYQSLRRLSGCVNRSSGVTRTVNSARRLFAQLSYPFLKNAEDGDYLAYGQVHHCFDPRMIHFIQQIEQLAPEVADAVPKRDSDHISCTRHVRVAMPSRVAEALDVGGEHDL